MTDKSSYIFLVLFLVAFTPAHASQDLRFPFAGTYQSLGSEAQELTSRENNAWVDIPQNVYLTFVKDQDILELRLLIEVLDRNGQKLYPIENSMWLRHVGNNQLEVYKLNRSSNDFDKVGAGGCSPMSCSYEYVIWVQNNGNPYQQRYMSTIKWKDGSTASGFTQSGSLSAKVSDVEDGQDPWLVFKTWSNQFVPQTTP